MKEQTAAKETQMRCYAILLSHMSGFAAINFGGSLQHLDICVVYPLLTFLAPIFMYLFQVAMGRTIRIFRRKCIEKHDLAEGVKEGDYLALELELGETQMAQWHGQHYCLRKWDESVLEAEIDMAALAVSFLTVQACRFNISGVMPDKMGVEEKDYLHPQYMSAILLGFGTAFAVMAVFTVCLVDKFPEKPRPGTLEAFLKRTVLVTQNSCAMAFAWCLLFTGRWEIARFQNECLHPNMIVARVLLALFISFASYLFIAGLDFIADLEATGNTIDRAIINFILAISVLVGFSWEQAFDGAVEVIADLTGKEGSTRPIMVEMALALLVTVVAITPWKRHILRKVIQLEEEQNERREEELAKEEMDALSERSTLDDTMSRESSDLGNSDG